MYISAIFPIIYGYFLSVTDDSREHADNVPVGYAVLPLPAVVAADNIVVPAHFQYAVQHILSAVTLV